LQNTLNEQNYDEFVSYFQGTFRREVILELIRKRVSSDNKMLEEFKAVLEYMTFLGRNYLEREELDRLQDAINFRLNRLENYSHDYFAINFFMCKSQTKTIMDELESTRYYYPMNLLKDLKNLILAIERGEAESYHLADEAQDLITRQIKLIRENQDKLKDLNSEN